MRTLFALIFLLSGHLFGQTQIHMSHRVYGQNVWLRWQTNDMSSMMRMSDSGFHVYRQLIEENGKTLTGSDIVRLTANKVVRMPETVFENIAKTHPSALLLWQCLTGEKPETETTWAQTIDNARSNDWCLLSSSIAMNDHFESALAAGFGFIDNTAKPNAVYVYKIEYILGKDTLSQSILVHTGIQYKDIQPEKPVLSRSEKGEVVSISFPRQPHFWGYELEKSLDGSHFTGVYTLPFVQSGNSERIQMTDSIRHNGVSVYRVRGIDEFGQRSQTSDTAIIQHENFSAENTVLSLELMEVQKDIALIKIRGLKKASDIRILSADSLFGFYTPFSTHKEITDNSIIRINISFSPKYLLAETTESNGKKTQSLPLLLQREDKTPPGIPTSPTIHIAEQAIHLSWQKNTDPDLLGYRIYRGDKRKFEFMPIHSDYISDTFFTDTIAFGTIRDSIFYTITAVDKRFNESPFSAVAAQEWNDNIPPPSAIIETASLHDGYITLKAIVPQDKNIDKIYLYRRETASEKPYTLISAQFSHDSIVTFNDSSGTSEKVYGYHLICQDKWGLNSKKTDDVVVRFPERKWLPSVAPPLAVKDSLQNIIHLYWTYPYKNEVSHYRIYAHTTAGQTTTIGTCSGTEEYFAYYGANKNQTYTFSIVAYSKNGRKSK